MRKLMICCAVVLAAVLLALAGHELLATRHTQRVVPDAAPVSRQAEPPTVEDLPRELLFHTEGTAALEGTVVVKGTTRPPGSPVTVEIAIIWPRERSRVHRLTATASGGFSIPAVVWPGQCRLSCVSSDGSIRFEDTFAFREPDGSEPIELRVEVIEESIVSGRVTTVQGEPIPDARVFCDVVSRPPGNDVDRYDMRADTSGRFEFRVPQVDVARFLIRVGAAAVGHAPAQGAWTSVTPVRHETEVRLSPMPIAHGIVVDDAGKPVAGAVVTLSTQKSVPRDSPSRANHWVRSRAGAGVGSFGRYDSATWTELGLTYDKTGKDGRFAVTFPALGTRGNLVVYAEGAPAVIRGLGESSMLTPGLDAGRITLEFRAPAIDVRFVYADGQPATDTEVRFQNADVSQFLQVNSKRFHTDDRGTIRTNFVRKGSAYTLFMSGNRIQSLETAHIVIRDNSRVVVPE